MHGRAEEGGAGASGREEQQRDPSAQVSAAQGGEEAAVPPPRRSAAPLQKEATVVHYCEPSRAAATTATLRASCPSAPQAAGGWLTIYSRGRMCAEILLRGVLQYKMVVAAAVAARQRCF
jgi:hypothetical protein